MLDSLERFVLLYDLSLKTARKETEFPPLEEIATAIVKRVNEGKAKVVLPEYTDGGGAPWLRIKKAQVKKMPSGSKMLILLFSIGDPRAANPSFEHSETAKLRTVQKEEKEGNAVTAHALVSLKDSRRGRYKMVVEDIRGLGRTRLRDILAKEFKEISKQYNLAYTNNAGESVETYIIPDLQGHKSEKIGESLKRSTITGVYLIDSVGREQLDEVDGADITRREIKVVVTKASAIEALRRWGADQQFDRMRIVWNDPKGVGKPERASVDITQKDVQDNYFVKQYKIRVREKLDQASDDIRDDLINAMYDQVK